MALLQIGTAGIVGMVIGAAFVAALVLRVAQGGGVAASLATPVVLPKELPPAVVTALAAGRKIEAIKAYREATGCDLLTAKQVCDEIERTALPPH